MSASGAQQWSPYVFYNQFDVVQYGAFNYEATTTNQNVVPYPTTAEWTLVNPGGGGSVGPTGPAGSLNNPLTSNLDCGAYEVQFATAVRTDNISLAGISLATRIDVQNALDITDPTNATRFQSVAPQCAVGPTGPDDLCNKAYVDSVVGSGGTGPTGPAGPAGLPQNYLATTTGTLIVQPSTFTFTTSNQDCYFGSPVPLTNGAIASFTPPVVINSDYLNCSCFIPTQYGFLLYPGSGPTNGSAVPVYNGAPAFFDVFSYDVGDTLALQITSSIINYQKNGVTLRTSVPVAPLPATTTYTFVGPTVVDGPYTTTNAQLYAYGSIPGATGPTGPFSQALANKLLIDEVSDPAGGIVNLTWSTGDPASEYVPLYPSTTTTTLAPIDPATTGTGWRFSKTYTLLTVSSLPAPITMVTGATYTIITPSNVVWTDLGAPNNNAGTQFTYNGHPTITGNNGTVYASTKISWYALNALYSFLSPANTLPTMIVPSTAMHIRCDCPRAVK